MARDLRLLRVRGGSAAIVRGGADRRDDPQSDQPGRRVAEWRAARFHQDHPDLRGSLLRRHLRRGVLSLATHAAGFITQTSGGQACRDLSRFHWKTSRISSLLWKPLNPAW